MGTRVRKLIVWEFREKEKIICTRDENNNKKKVSESRTRNQRCSFNPRTNTHLFRTTGNVLWDDDETIQNLNKNYIRRN